MLDKGDAFMILSTKIALPTVDIVTDVLGIKKVLSLPDKTQLNHYLENHGRHCWEDPRIDRWGSGELYKCRSLTIQDWNNFTEYEKNEFIDINGTDYTNLYVVAYAMAFFVVLSWIMTIPHYLRVEKTLRQKLKALPFLMVSSWPQYRGFRLIWLAYIAKNEVKFREEKKEFEQNLSHIGTLPKYLIDITFKLRS